MRCFCGLAVNSVGIVHLTFMCLLFVFLVFDLVVAYVCLRVGCLIGSVLLSTCGGVCCCLFYCGGLV